MIRVAVIGWEKLGLQTSFDQVLTLTHPTAKPEQSELHKYNYSFI